MRTGLFFWTKIEIIKLKSVQTKTEKELREEFIESIKRLSKHWASQELSSKEEACEGVAFSILSLMDGCSGLFPHSIDIVVRQSSEDNEHLIEENRKIVKDKTTINKKVMMHEEFFK